MKIAMLGAGAMGSFLGAALKKGGADVWLVDPFKEHINKIANEGLKINLNGVDETVHINAVTTPYQAGVCDVVIVMVKGLYTDEALKGAQALFDENTFVFSFQNGVGNVEILQKYFSVERLGYGVVTIGSSLVEPGKIKVTKSAGTVAYFVSAAKGEKPCVFQKIEEYFNAGGIGIQYSEEVDKTIWNKLLNNCCINLTCGLCRVNMGQFFYAPDGRALQELIAKEVIAVANAKGIDITWDEAWNLYVDHGVMANLNHYPSATQDVMKKRKTEIDFLNGAVSRIGKEVGVPTPINDTITMLAHVLENTYDMQF